VFAGHPGQSFIGSVTASKLLFCLIFPNQMIDRNKTEFIECD
jgi:hypothetical protein